MDSLWNEYHDLKAEHDNVWGKAWEQQTSPTKHQQNLEEKLRNILRELHSKHGEAHVNERLGQGVQTTSR